jgi:hypothetical protein
VLVAAVAVEALLGGVVVAAAERCSLAALLLVRCVSELVESTWTAGGFVLSR